MVPFNLLLGSTDSRPIIVCMMHNSTWKCYPQAMPKGVLDQIKKKIMILFIYFFCQNQGITAESND